jgi:two-component system sensor histidine kinase RegB
MSDGSRSFSWTEALIPKGDSQSSINRQGLQRLLLLRSFVTLTGTVGMMIFASFSDLVIPYSSIYLLIAAVFVSVVISFWRLRQSWIVSQAELFWHILIDAAFLIILLLFAGGVSNPLISYLLVLLAVTATLLPRPYVYGFALGSIVLYTSFLFLDTQTDHGAMDAPMPQNMVFQLHLVGMWVIFLVSAILITVFITRMAIAIRERESNLAQARENEMRNEQLVAIGTLAAGTAHALGTPLSTMSVLLNELDKLDAQQLKESDIKDDISVLREQVTRCKNSLNQLIRYYNKDRPADSEEMHLDEFVNDISDYITNIHPTAVVEFRIKGNGQQLLRADPSLKHGVINIIENGIKAASSKVDVLFSVLSPDTPGGTKQLEIAVTDDGPGIPAQVLENMGEPFISMRKDSMGLGIFLANATVQRLGGKIEMFNLKIGGALTVIKLPLPASE